MHPLPRASLPENSARAQHRPGHAWLPPLAAGPRCAGPLRQGHHERPTAVWGDGTGACLAAQQGRAGCAGGRSVGVPALQGALREAGATPGGRPELTLAEFAVPSALLSAASSCLACSTLLCSAWCTRCWLAPSLCILVKLLFSVCSLPARWVQELAYDTPGVLGHAATWPQAAAALPQPADGFDWEGDRPLGLPLEDLVIYEMHVRGFTRDPASGVSAPGEPAACPAGVPAPRRVPPPRAAWCCSQLGRLSTASQNPAGRPPGHMSRAHSRKLMQHIKQPTAGQRSCWPRAAHQHPAPLPAHLCAVNPARRHLPRHRGAAGLHPVPGRERD